MKNIILFTFLLLTCLRLNASDDKNLITFKFDRIVTAEDVKDIQHQLTTGYGEKILAVNYDPINNEFVLKITDQFNRIEVLGIFREFGYVSYFDENGFRYRLNGVGNDLVVSQIKD